MSSAPATISGPVGVVGAGRMGRALVARLDGAREVVVVSRHATTLARQDGRRVAVATDPAVLVDCAAVLLAVPADGISAALDRIRPHLRDGALAVNLATDVPTSRLDGHGVRLVGCKIIGQSGQIERGVRAALVLDGASRHERDVLAAVFDGIGDVVDGAEAMVAQVNDLVARRVIRAQFGVADELAKMGLPAAARDAAIRNLALGIWHAVATGNTGPYLTGLLHEYG